MRGNIIENKILCQLRNPPHKGRTERKVSYYRISIKAECDVRHRPSAKEITKIERSFNLLYSWTYTIHENLMKNIFQIVKLATGLFSFFKDLHAYQRDRERIKITSVIG